MKNKQIAVVLDGVARLLAERVQKTFARRYSEREQPLIEEFSPFKNLGLDEDEIVEFIYDSAVEIFGKGELTYKDVIRDLNYLATIMAQHGYEFTVVSREMEATIPATYFWLSDKGCKIRNVKFVKSYSQLWKNYGIVITGDPHVITSKPKNGRLFVLNNEQNKHIEGLDKSRVGTLQDIFGKFRLKGD